MLVWIWNGNRSVWRRLVDLSQAPANGNPAMERGVVGLFSVHVFRRDVRRGGCICWSSGAIQVSTRFALLPRPVWYDNGDFRAHGRTPPVEVWFFGNNFFCGNFHGTRFETMAILVKALKCVTKRLRAFP